MIDWSIVKHFSSDEKWGDVTKIHPKLILSLDRMRDYAKVPFVIHCAYELSGHSPKSYHKYGMAVDGHFKGLDLLDQFFIADRFFGDAGIGVYGSDVWKKPGIHVDIRCWIARWHCIKKDGKRIYIPIKSNFFKKIFYNALKNPYPKK